MKTRPHSLSSFSLVEVVIALGLVSFCLVALIALLPVSLQSVKEARQYAAASSGVEKIAMAIRLASAATNEPDQYQALGSYSNLVWEIGGSEVHYVITNISLSGDPVTTSRPQLAAHIEITPPETLFSYGTALISVAWPNRAIWNSANSTWSNAQGSISSWLIFIPKQ